MPRVRVKLVRNGFKTWRALPYLPGYLFCAYDPFLSLWELSKLPGISTIIRMDGYPVLIRGDDPQMTELIAMTDEQGFVKKPEVQPITKLEVGDLITMPPKSAFGAGERVEILGVDNSQFVTVEVTIFGAKRPVQVRHVDVDLAAVERRRVAKPQLSATFAA